MTRYPRLMPTDPRLFRATVVRSVRTSPSFQRVTIAGADLADFEWSGHDHWFRLFLPPAADVPLQLPAVSGRAWYRRYLEIPEADRPHCSNYTVADYRPAAGPVGAASGAHTGPAGAASGAPAELDIDVVLHWEASGEIAGRVAIWATTTRPGSEVALLDQGPLFDPPADVRGVHLVADETGLPALRGILRSLDERMTGTATIEVPLEGDIEPLEAPAGIRLRWYARGAGHGAGRSHPRAAVAAVPPVAVSPVVAAAVPPVDTVATHPVGAVATPPVGTAPAPGPGRPAATTVAAAPVAVMPGAAALAAVRGGLDLDPGDYAFIVGEASLATEGRRALHRAGLPKSRITFSGYWKHAPAHS
ncbi:siderophore-interacting protein [Subtercola sp. YIM 133946]|uniref:siderophore-interacting protein n=1 Tax=Subtercola sp. YIM 133946 TaxID=3118909 RepID=UPI002F937E3D